MTIFFGVWLCGWAAGGAAILTAVLFGDQPTSEKLYMAGWLLAWTVAGVLAGILWSWITFGRTLVEAGNGILHLRWDVLGIGFSRSYDAKQIKKLRPQIYFVRWLWSRWPRGESPFAGTILFDYRGMTIDFGAGLDEAEAGIVIAEISKLLPLTSDTTTEMD